MAQAGSEWGKGRSAKERPRAETDEVPGGGGERAPGYLSSANRIVIV